MKRNFGKIFGGFCLILLGLVWILETLDIVHVRLFDGWWTLLILVPSFVNLFTERNKAGAIGGLAFGTLLLLACQDVISMGLAFRLMIPVIIIIVGFSILFSIRNKASSKIQDQDRKTADGKTHSSVFAGDDLSFDGQNIDEALHINAVFGGSDCTFHNAAVRTNAVLDMTAVFGGIECNFKNTYFEDGATLNISTVFGGVDLYLPETVNVKVNSTSILGGVDNKNKETTEGKPTVQVNCTAIFGGIELH